MCIRSHLRILSVFCLFWSAGLLLESLPGTERGDQRQPVGTYWDIDPGLDTVETLFEGFMRTSFLKDLW